MRSRLPVDSQAGRWLWADVLATAAFVAGDDALDLVAAVPGYQALVVARDGTVSQSDHLVRLR